MHPTVRVRASSLVTQPDGSRVHFSGYRQATIWQAIELEAEPNPQWRPSWRMAERRLGEMLAAQKADGGLNRGVRAAGNKLGNGQGSPALVCDEDRPKLSDAGISYDLSSRAQKLAAVPESHAGDTVGFGLPDFLSVCPCVKEGDGRPGANQRRGEQPFISIFAECWSAELDACGGNEQLASFGSALGFSQVGGNEAVTRTTSVIPGERSCHGQ